MNRAWLVGLVVLAGCGRVGFGAVGDGGGDGGSGGSGGSGLGVGSDGPSAFAIGQRKSANQTAANSSSNHVELTMPQPGTEGDVLVIGVDTETIANQTVAMSDSAGLAFTRVMGPIGDGYITEWLFVAPVAGTAGVADRIAVDVSLGAPSFLELRVHEIAGLRTDITTAPSAFAYGIASTGDPIASPLLGVAAQSLVIGYGVAQTTLDPGAGWATLELDFDDLVEYQTTAAGGNFTATATDQGGGDWVMSIAALPLQ